jgi:hypothetical protein
VRQGVGDVLGGKLRDVLRVDDFDDGIGIALVLEVLVDRLAKTRDDDRLERSGIGGIPVFFLWAFLSFALSDADAGAGVVVEVAAGADVCAKATAGIPRPPPNDKVAKASAAYKGLRVNTCGR